MVNAHSNEMVLNLIFQLFRVNLHMLNSLFHNLFALRA